MNRLIIFLAFTMTTLSCSCQNKNGDEFLNQEPDELFKQQILDNNFVGASAGYTINGETQWKSAIGFADKNSKMPFEQETKTRMASIAKSMTALAVMQLVEQNLIDLDSPIQTYIPDYPKQHKTQITTKHLLSHTSGIDGYKNTKEAETKINYPRLSDAVELFKNRPLLFEPGTKYSYTTYGYTLLGVIIESVSGLTYEAYMQKNIWNKAKMTNTGIDVYGVKKENTSTLYRKNRRGKVEIGEENNLSNRIPGGGLYTTAGDMIKFGNAVINNTFVKSETLSLMRQRHSLEKGNNAYGFGWFLYNPKPNEGAIIGHSGAQTGCSSQIFIIPEKDVVVVVLANTSRGSKEVTNLAIQLLKKAVSEL